MPELAEFYNDQIKVVLGQKEFMLGGWSFGRNVAYEMACQLADNHKNPKIFFFDSWNFSHLDFPHEQHMREAISNYIPEVIDLPAGYDMRNKQDFFDFLCKRMQLALNQKYSMHNIPVVLFKSTNILPQFQRIDCVNNHWRKVIADEKLSVISINSTHDELFSLCG